jgi:membrane fusion protein, multidrug efflux system
VKKEAMPSPDAIVRSRPRRAGVLALALLAPLLAAGCGDSSESQQVAPQPVPVTVGDVTREAVPTLVQAIGAVVAQQTVSVRPQVGGQILSVHFREGEDVKKGELLATIDPRSYQAALAQAQAQLARDQAQATKASQDIDRYADLVKKDYVTQEQYDQIVATAAAAKATLAADEAAVESARLDLDRTAIRAPIGGRTGQVLIHAGNLVKDNDDRALVVIQQMEPIDVGFSVPQASLNAIRARAADELEVAATPAQAEAATQHGSLSFVDNTVDTSTGTIALKATFPNADRALWPGEFVDVSLTLSTESDAVVAPATAVQAGQDGDYVFVVKPDDTVESRKVTVDRTVGAKAVIAEGLTGGERVVTDGQLRLIPGSKIEIKTGTSAPAGGAAPAGEEAGR